MTAAEQIVLPPSPLWLSPMTTLPMSKNAPSSSPGLPSPSQLLMSKLAGRPSGRRALPVPKDARMGSMSAASFLLSATGDDQSITHPSMGSFILRAKESIEDMKTETPRASEEDDGTHHGKGKSGKRQRSRKSNKSPKLSSAKTRVNDGERSHTGKGSMTKQTGKDAQSKIKKAKITKPGADTAGSKRSEGKIEEDSRSIGAGSKAGVVIHEGQCASPVQSEQSLGLAEAPKRRRDWTPPKRARDVGQISEDENASSARVTSESPASVKALHGGFGKLIGDFGFADASHAATTRVGEFRSVSGECGTKRRRLDLVADVVQTLPKAAPIKTSKAPKKKPLTITGKATAPFVREDQVPASIRDYFATPPLETAVRSPIPASTGQRKVAIRGTAHILLPEKTDAIKVKPKVARKAKPPAIVVPPESAIKTANEQNLLFGTSSQLALEESPTFIRDMQQAVRESEVIDLPTSVPREDESQVSIQSTVSNLMNSRSITASRKLWSVSARDSTGSLLNVDVVDLANTPQPSRPLSMEGEEPRWKRLAEHPPEDRQATLDTGWKTVEDVTKAEEAAALGINPHPQPDDTSLPRSVAEASLRERPRSKSPVKKPGKGKGFQSSETESSLPEMPNYNGFADTDLRKELVALGFKPIKRRKEIIPLLQKCWESKNRVALQSLPPNVAIAPSSANVLPEKASESNSPAKQGGRPPKKPSAKSDPNGSEADVFASPRKARGRPKRNAATQVPSSKRQTQTSNEDIVDAGYTRPTSSPCRRVAAKPPVSPTLTTSLPVTAAADATEALFKTITKAITSYPPTHDAKNLTWYEKILLYDPIVLEDLADWLDKVGLSRVGYAGKVTPRMTKQWCESQSICCVWRENLRGGTRARY